MSEQATMPELIPEQASDEDLPNIGKVGSRLAARVLNDLANGLNLAVICKNTGLSRADVGNILTSNVGRDYLKKTKARSDLELDGKMTTALLQGTEKLLDRIEHGDIILMKGKLVRIPLSAKDLAFCISVLFDKRKGIRELPQASEISDGLHLIAEKLSQLGQQQTIAGHAREPEGIEDAEILPSQVPATQKDILLSFNALEQGLAEKGTTARVENARGKFNIINGLE